MTMMSSSNPLQPRIKEIHDKAKSAIFSIECYFINMNNQNLQMKISYINRIDIFHNFMEKCMENIEIDFELDVPDYQKLLQWYNELRCFFKMNFYDDQKMEKKEEFFRCNYRVLLPKLQDIRQVLPQKELYNKDNPDEDMTAMKRGERVHIKAQLMTEEAYMVSKLKMNAILPNATVEQAILTFIDALKIKKFCMIPPDNKTVYKNLKLPPMQDIFTIFDHLHSTYGIYNSYGGMYFDNNCLFVYPIFVTEGKSTDTFHIYKAPPGYLMGAKGTSIIENGDLFMFTNQLSHHKITAVKELENVGNSYYSFNTGKMIDNWTTHAENGSSISDDNPDIFNANFSKGATEQTHVPVFEINRNNEFVVKSKLAALGVSILEIGWSAALPFLIKPFQKMKYHYEHNEQQKTVSCTCPSVTYILNKESRFQEPLFSCIASMKLLTNNSTDNLD